jgi:hypothetical protein
VILYCAEWRCCFCKYYYNGWWWLLIKEESFCRMNIQTLQHVCMMMYRLYSSNFSFAFDKTSWTAKRLSDSQEPWSTEGCFQLSWSVYRWLVWVYLSTMRNSIHRNSSTLNHHLQFGTAGSVYLKKYQYDETNVMYFSFNLLRIKSLYMFRALLAHPQELLHKRHLVYCVGMSVGCATIAVSLHAIYQVPFVQKLLRMSK